MGCEEDDDLDYGYASYEYDVRKEMAAKVSNDNCTHYMCEHGEHGFDSYQDCFKSAIYVSKIKDKCFNNAINLMIAELASTPLAGKPSIDLAKKMYEVYLNGEVKI